MDRSEEWRIFVTVASRRSFAGAARSLGKSPQAVTRAIAALEDRIGTKLLHRTTRSVSLTDQGAKQLERARHVLGELDALESRSGADAPPAGTLSVTAPVLFGQLHVLPLVAELLAAHPDLDVRLFLVDRHVSLADEGIDVAVRIGHLPDSALRTRVVAHVRQVLCASPGYLRRRGVPRNVAALSRHDCIALPPLTPVVDRWSFPPRPGARREQVVAVRPRLVVNTAAAAVDAAVAGLGIARVLSYQVSHLVAARKLDVVLRSAEPPPIPVQLVHLPGTPTRAAAAFVELAAASLVLLLRERPGPKA